MCGSIFRANTKDMGGANEKRKSNNKNLQALQNRNS